jgi:IS4 transposase
MMALQWIEEEFSTLDLNDKRRERRARIIVEQLSTMADSTPDACRDNAALEATYRFADNAAISPEAILVSHRQAAISRSAACDMVILAQDTTVIDLTKPKLQVKGAGPLESNDKFGFFFHPLYAISEQGVPLGIVDHVTWVRDPIRDDLTRSERAAQRRQACYEEKESYRWLEMFQSGEQIARANPQTHYVHVADSESDIYELFLEIESQAENHDFILRGCQNRSLVQHEDAPDSIDKALARCEILSECEVNISERTSMISDETRPRRKSRSARIATVGIRATTVTMRGPSRAGGRLGNVTLNVVEAIELDPPEGEESIRWVLFTSLPIETIIEVQRVVSRYSLRWGIELFFKTLKSGLGIEKLKYETIERYLTASSLMLVVAWRVEQIKVAARVDGDASCEKYFESAEWKPAYMVAKKTRVLPPTAPTMEEFVLLLAKLGGYLKKKGQGPPGSTTLWRGLRKLEAYRDAYIAFGST